MTTEDKITEKNAEDADNIPSNGEEAFQDQNSEKENLSPASENEISRMTEQLAIEKDRVLRLSAEFENYKKRKQREIDEFKKFAKQREIDEFKKFANETVFKQLLSVVDNLERAIDAASARKQEEESAPENSAGFLGGVEMIHKEILTILENFHVSPVDAQDQPFDHNFHQAVTQEETQEVPDKTVIRVLQKGYAFHDRLLRPAMVVVSKTPAQDKK